MASSLTPMRIKEIASCRNHGRTTIVLEDESHRLTLTFHADREEARRLVQEVTRPGCACHPIYDFIAGLLRALAATPTRVVLGDAAGQGIGGVIVVRHGEVEVGLPCYPPDGLALAIRFRLPLYATTEALAHAEQARPAAESGDNKGDIERWLERVRPEDFSS